MRTGVLAAVRGLALALLAMAGSLVLFIFFVVFTALSVIGVVERFRIRPQCSGVHDGVKRTLPRSGEESRFAAKANRRLLA